MRSMALGMTLDLDRTWLRLPRGETSPDLHPDRDEAGPFLLIRDSSAFEGYKYTVLQKMILFDTSGSFLEDLPPPSLEETFLHFPTLR